VGASEQRGFINAHLRVWGGEREVVVRPPAGRSPVCDHRQSENTLGDGNEMPWGKSHLGMERGPLLGQRLNSVHVPHYLGRNQSNVTTFRTRSANGKERRREDVSKTTLFPQLQESLLYEGDRIGG